MKKLFVIAIAAAMYSTAFADSSIGPDGFIKVEAIKGDSQYNNRVKDVQGIKGSWTNKDLPELRRLQRGMSKGQIRDALDSESVNYSSGWRGDEWQHAYNYQAGSQDGEHNICIVRVEFDKGVAKDLEFKHVNSDTIGSDVSVCKPELPKGETKVIIREVVETQAAIRQ